MSDFCMPSLGADMDSGVLLEWRVHPGDRVKRGDIVAVVDTQKAEIEIEVFEDGVVSELLVPEGERVAVGTAIARLDAGRPAVAVPLPVGDRRKRPPRRAGRGPGRHTAASLAGRAPHRRVAGGRRGAPPRHGTARSRNQS